MKELKELTFPPEAEEMAIKYAAFDIMKQLYMSTENSVNRSLKTRSLLTKFGTCNITATGAVTI